MASISNSGAPMILLADDDDAVRDLLELCLQSMGYRVLTAQDGEGALQQMLEVGDEVELLITDSTMPRLGGVELCEQLRRSHPKVKTLLISGHSEGPCSESMLKRRGIAFMKKPFPLPALAAKIRDLLA